MKAIQVPLNKAKAQNKARGRPPKTNEVSRALFKEDKNSAQKSKSITSIYSQK